MEYNIGQKAKLDMKLVKNFCSMPPYLKLVNSCKDEYGFVSLTGVEGDLADIGNFLGKVMIPLAALIF
jgi:hypothetical protein